MKKPPTPCSRCGSPYPNSGCFVCGEHPDDCEFHVCKADRLAALGVRLRDEMKDKEFEKEGA